MSNTDSIIDRTYRDVLMGRFNSKQPTKKKKKKEIWNPLSTENNNLGTHWNNVEEYIDGVEFVYYTQTIHGNFYPTVDDLKDEYNALWPPKGAAQGGIRGTITAVANKVMERYIKEYVLPWLERNQNHFKKIILQFPSGTRTYGEEAPIVNNDNNFVSTQTPVNHESRSWNFRIMDVIGDGNCGLYCLFYSGLFDFRKLPDALMEKVMVEFDNGSFTNVKSADTMVQLRRIICIIFDIYYHGVGEERSFMDQNFKKLIDYYNTKEGGYLLGSESVDGFIFESSVTNHEIPTGLENQFKSSKQLQSGLNELCINRNHIDELCMVLLSYVFRTPITIISTTRCTISTTGVILYILSGEDVTYDDTMYLVHSYKTMKTLRDEYDVVFTECTNHIHLYHHHDKHPFDPNISAHKETIHDSENTYLGNHFNILEMVTESDAERLVKDDGWQHFMIELKTVDPKTRPQLSVSDKIFQCIEQKKTLYEDVCVLTPSLEHNKSGRSSNNIPNSVNEKKNVGERLNIDKVSNVIITVDNEIVTCESSSTNDVISETVVDIEECDDVTDSMTQTQNKKRINSTRKENKKAKKQCTLESIDILDDHPKMAEKKNTTTDVGIQSLIKAGYTLDNSSISHRSISSTNTEKRMDKDNDINTPMELEEQEKIHVNNTSTSTITETHGQPSNVKEHKANDRKFKKKDNDDEVIVWDASAEMLKLLRDNNEQLKNMRNEITQLRTKINNISNSIKKINKMQKEEYKKDSNPNDRKCHLTEEEKIDCAAEVVKRLKNGGYKILSDTNIKNVISEDPNLSKWSATSFKRWIFHFEIDYSPLTLRKYRNNN